MAAIGIDIGKTELHVCSNDPSTNPRSWPVTKIDLAREDWHWQLVALVPAGSHVIVEPTGWHYLAPLITALETFGSGCKIWQVNNQLTKHVRRVHVATAKTDAMDARTLALVGQWVDNGAAPRSVKPLDLARTTQVHELRLLMNRHQSLVRHQTRVLNQLDALGHGIWPALVQSKNTWLNAVGQGAVTPLQIHSLLQSSTPDLSGIQRYWINKLAEKMPANIHADPPIIEAVLQTHATLQLYIEDIATITTTVEHVVQSDPFAEVTRRWLSVPTISLMDIAAFHVAVDGQAETITTDQFKVALGASPTSVISSSINRTSKTRAGYRPAIRALFLLAMRLMQGKAAPNVIHTYRQRGKSGAAARTKLARILSGIARNPQGSFPS